MTRLEDMFRAYDIRGRYGKELTEDVMQRIGQAFGTDLREQHNEDTAVVGHDVRDSSPDLQAAFCEGLASTGVDVIDTGFSSYGPALFYAWQKQVPSAFITASHLPKDWNGVKFAHGTGIGYTEEENNAVRDAFFAEDFATGEGAITKKSPIGVYRDHILEAVHPDEISALLDCGNGSSCVVAPDLFTAAGIEADVINGEPDGSFPNRASDVTEETLGELMEAVAHKDYELGIAFDGDADRLAVVDDTGRLLSSEQLAYVLLDTLFTERDGPVVANVECSRMLEDIAEQHGREVIRVRVGHTYLFKAMQDHDACFGVEKSGHMGIPHVFPLDDGVAVGLYAAAVVSQSEHDLSELVDAIPRYHRDRIAYDVPDSEKFDLVERLQDRLTERYDNTNTMDGIRVDLPDGWALIRASNTSPKIRLTVEAETLDAYDRIRDEFQDHIAAER